MLGAVLCSVGYLRASLAYTHEMPVACSPTPPGCDNKKRCLQTLPSICWAARSTLVKNPFFREGNGIVCSKIYKVKVKSLSHVQLCYRMDCNLPGSSIHGIFQARILEFPSSGDLPDLGSNPGLPHCRQTLYPLSHQENPKVYKDPKCFKKLRERGLFRKNRMIA